MESISALLPRFQNEKGPPHEQAAKVDLIIEIVGVSKVYNYTYWLRKVKKFSYGYILQICKDANGLDKSKYNVGGFITNKLHGKK